MSVLYTHINVEVQKNFVLMDFKIQNLVDEVSPQTLLTDFGVSWCAFKFKAPLLATETEAPPSK